MGLANKSVVLYESIKVGKKWVFCPVDEDSSHFSNGPFYVSWYDGRKKQMNPVGRDPEHALRMANLKRAALAYVAAGGEVKDTSRVQNPAQGSAEREVKNGNQAQLPAGEKTESEVKKDNPVPNSIEDRKSVSTAISEYLADCDDRQGKSGYGLAPRTPETYKYRLGFLSEFRPKAFLDEIDEAFVKAFRRFLREHKKDLSDRTSYNIMQAVSTFLLRNGIAAAKPILKEMSFPPTEVIPYSDDEMRTFFAACDEKEELIFKFFLHSMAREMEVANCEARDLKFDINVLHICPKPDRDFRLKGKRSGQAKKGRKVPIPAIFMARMKEFCAGKGQRQLLFPNGLGEVEFHFLRKCKSIARRTGIVGWEDFDLHRWRKTGATKHHNDGVSVRTIQAWLGHESLEVTLDYLGVDDAAGESSQQQVNSGALAAFV
jgi:integrase